METIEKIMIRETSTILATLTFYQQHFENHKGRDKDDIKAIATNLGTLKALHTEEIDELRERLNLGDIEIIVPNTRRQKNE
jgi:hypothetical protein